MTTAPMTSNNPADFLGNLLNQVGSWGNYYLANRLAYERAEDEIQLYALQLQAHQQVAQNTAQVQGASSSIPETVGGVPTWAVALGAVAVIGGIIWAVK